ncbi:MAG: acyl--CoA ligase, partial [Candidatus Thiodiazotropha sp. (ex Lucinoma borealis)]|nr:acyl--CoA ligase [Candidatus Thiodiazotropha sp. (ex Lucinoma borealis)]
IVKMDREGYLYFLGRNDDLIKTSGYRVSPNEIEEIFFGTGLVSEVVAFGVPHSTLGQSIALVVIPKPGIEVTEDNLINVCKKRLASYMMPTEIVFRTSMPSNPNGKVDRKQLALEMVEPFSHQ